MHIISLKNADDSERRAVIYVSHLPHGFYEKELPQYLVQFGAVTNLGKVRCDVPISLSLSRVHGIMSTHQLIK